MRKNGWNHTAWLAAAFICAAAVLTTGCADNSAQSTEKETAQAETTQAPAAAAKAATESAPAAETTQEEAAEAVTLDEESGADLSLQLAEGIDLGGLPHIPAEDYPKVDGSTATLPLSYELYALCTGSTYSEAQKAVTHSKTDQSYYAMLADGDYAADLLLVYEPSDQTKADIKNNKVKLTSEKIGLDALVFLENAGNRADKLTTAQLQDIYSGKIRNWSQVGGADKEIAAFQRVENSGSQTLMKKLVMKGIRMQQAPSYKTPSEMGQLIENVASYSNAENAIGYSVYFYARNMYSMPNLKFVSVDGAQPSPQTIRDGSYPFVNPFYAVIRSDEPADSYAKKLYDWLASAPGQQLIEKLGYVPVTAGKETESGAAIGSNGTTENSAASVSGQLLQIRGGSELSLKDDQYILLDGHQTALDDSLHIYDRHLKEVKTISGVSPSSRLTVTLVRKGSAISASDDQTGLSGLYDLFEEKWVVQPTYTYMSANDDGSFTGSSDEADSSAYNFIYRDGKIEKTKPYYNKVGDAYWNDDDGDNVITVTDRSGREIGTIDLAAQNMRTGYAVDPYYIAYTGDLDDTCILNSDGDVVLTKQMLSDDDLKKLEISRGDLDQLTFYYFDLNKQADIVSCALEKNGDYDGRIEFLYDLGAGQVITNRNDKISSTYMDDYSTPVFLVHGEDGDKLYTDLDTPAVSEDGHAFTFALQDGWYGYRPDDKTILVEKQDGSQKYTLAVPKTKDEESNPGIGRCVAKDMFIFSAEDEATLWQGSRCIRKAEYIGDIPYGDYVAIQDPDHPLMIVDKTDGSVIFRTSYSTQYVENIEQPVMVLREGNYAAVMDLQGNEVMRVMERW